MISEKELSEPEDQVAGEAQSLASPSRRTLAFKLSIAGSAAVGWSTPVIKHVILPAHAQTSAPDGDGGGSTTVDPAAGTTTPTTTLPLTTTAPPTTTVDPTISNGQSCQCPNATVNFCSPSAGGGTIDCNTLTPTATSRCRGPFGAPGSGTSPGQKMGQCSTS